jgi:glycosyltransferase involved in cell wall biosynthesis
MKVLNVGGYTWNIGGSAKVMFDHADYQGKNGVKVTILTPISAGEVLLPCPTNGTIVTCKRGIIGRILPEFSLEGFWWLYKNRNEFDIIHIHGLFHFIGIAPFLLNTRAKRVVTVHGCLQRWALKRSEFRKYLFSWFFQREAIEKADLIHVLHEQEADELKRYLKKDHHNVCIVANGIRTADFENLPPKGTFRKKIGIDIDTPMALFMSRLDAKKGIDMLLPAFLKIVKEKPQSVMVFAGADYGMQKKIEEFRRIYFIEENIKIVGLITGEDKLAALHDAHAFVLPSYSEGLSIAALEAMAAGTPLVVSKKIGISDDLLEDKDAAAVVQITPDDIARGIRRFLSVPVVGIHFGKNAKAIAKEMYELENLTAKLLGEFRAL